MLRQCKCLAGAQLKSHGHGSVSPGPKSFLASVERGIGHCSRSEKAEIAHAHSLFPSRWMESSHGHGGEVRGVCLLSFVCSACRVPGLPLLRVGLLAMRAAAVRLWQSSMPRAPGEIVEEKLVLRSNIC